MRKFVRRALDKLEKLDHGQVRHLLMVLASENELLEDVMDSMTDGVLVMDERHNLIYSNKAAERLIPFNSSDPHESLIWEVVADRDLRDFLEKSLIQEEKVEDREFTLTKGGTVQTLSCGIIPLVKEGEIQGNILHIDDVTERRNKEARLRRAESLASLTTLAAGVAHEIKNPLGSIGIHIQLIQKMLQKNGCVEEDTAGKYLEVINEEIERLNGIIVDFLFAVRPMDTHFEECDFNHLLKDLLDFVHFELEEQEVQILECLSDDIPMLLLDDKFMKQALLNIIKNGVSAMPEGGTLSVSTTLKGEYVECRIEDTGIGIADENLEKIFEPYFTTKEFGSGLGLTVVYKVIKEHKGEISLSSKEGIGTAFTILLPIPQKYHRLLEQKDQKLITWKDE